MSKEINKHKSEIKQLTAEVKKLWERCKTKPSQDFKEKYLTERIKLRGLFMKTATRYKQENNINEALKILVYLKDEFDKNYPDINQVKKTLVLDSDLFKKIAYYHSLEKNYEEMIVLYHEVIKDIITLSKKKSSTPVNSIYPMYIGVYALHLAKLCKTVSWLDEGGIRDLGMMSQLVALSIDGRLGDSTWAKDIDKFLKHQPVQKFFTENFLSLNNISEAKIRSGLDYESTVSFHKNFLEIYSKYMDYFGAKSKAEILKLLKNIEEKIPAPTPAPTLAPTSAPIQAQDKDISARIIGREVIEERQLKITKKILALAEEGKSVKEIVSDLGYTRSLVLECLRDIFFPEGINESVTEANIRVGLLLRDNKIENYKNQVIKLADEGKNVSQIAKAIKSDMAFVEDALKKILIHDDSGLSTNDVKREIARILKEKQNLIKESKNKILSDKRHIDFMNKHRNVVEMHNEGKTLEEIGQVKGVTRERVRQILKRIEMHGPYEDLEIIDKDTYLEKKRKLNAAQRKQEFEKLTNENEKKLVELYKSGANNEKIKDEINFSSQGVVAECLEILKEQGKISPFRFSNKTGNSEEELAIIYETIQSMRDKGETLEEIGTALGYSRIWVALKIREMRDKGIYVADNHNMSGREYLRDWDKINSRSKEIIRLLEEGKRVSEIEKELSLYKGAVSRHIRTYLEDEVKEIYLNRKK